MKLPTWITLKHVPEEFFAVADEIAGGIGEVIGVDDANDQAQDPRFCVALDSSKGWEPSVQVTNETTKVTKLSSLTTTIFLLGVGSALTPLTVSRTVQKGPISGGTNLLDAIRARTTKIMIITKKLAPRLALTHQQEKVALATTRAIALSGNNKDTTRGRNTMRTRTKQMMTASPKLLPETARIEDMRQDGISVPTDTTRPSLNLGH